MATKIIQLSVKELLTLVGKQFKAELENLEGDRLTCSLEVVKPVFGKPTAIRFIYEGQE